MGCLRCAKRSTMDYTPPPSFARTRRLGSIRCTAEASCSEGGTASMDFGEKVLYHQIHPAKLAADVGASIVSTYLMWRHKFVAALLSAFVPATIASVLVIRYADLEKRKRSPFGRYIGGYMNRRVEA